MGEDALRVYRKLGGGLEHWRVQRLDMSQTVVWEAQTSFFVVGKP